MFEWLINEVSTDPLTYLIVFAAAGADVLFPLVPSETIVVAASVLSAQGGLFIGGIVVAAALGAFAGDNLAFLIGRRAGGPLANRLFRKPKSRRRLAWAEQAIAVRGPFLIVVGRFIPAGRSATTFAAGTLKMSYRRFLPADAAAAVAWAVYISMLGYLGGAAFEDNFWLPVLIALGVAFLVAAGVEAWRRIEKARTGRDVLIEEPEA
ncbi:MAG TPA: DedA family protein [Solirubrobacterales bacterium]